MKHASHRLAISGLILAMVCANTTPVFSKLLIAQGWTPLGLYVLTLLVMTVFLAAHEFMEMEEGGRWGMTREDVLGTVLTALSGGVLSPVLFFLGIEQVQAAESVLIGSLLPLFVVLFAVVFLGERFNQSTIIGGGLLVLGTVVLLWPAAVQATMSPGVPLLIGSSITGALTTIVHKKFVKHRHLDSVVLVRTALSLVTVLLLAVVLEPASFRQLAAPQNVWLVMGLPLIGFLLPFFLYFRALRHIRAVEAGLVAGTGPVAGVLLSAVFLGESVEVRHLVSLAFMVMGILYINVPLTKWRIVPSRLLEIGPLRR